MIEPNMFKMKSSISAARSIVKKYCVNSMVKEERAAAIIVIIILKRFLYRPGKRQPNGTNNKIFPSV